MTFSIVAWDPVSKMAGVAAATKHLAVGATVAHARGGVGAIATQAQTNPLLARQGLDLLESQRKLTNEADHLAPDQILEMVLSKDPDRNKRQIQIVDPQGNTAAWTGSDCFGWAGHKSFRYFSVAGNLLVDEQVLISMAEAYMVNNGKPLAERLLLSLEAAQSAGGDRRGQQSASVYVTQQAAYPYLDLRVDHHENPLQQLRLIYEESQKDYYQGLLKSMPAVPVQYADVQPLEVETPAIETANDITPVLVDLEPTQELL